MQLTYQKFDLPLKHVFTISRGSVAVQETLVVQLSHGGQHGYGESTTNPYYGATIERMSAAIESVRAGIERDELDAPEALLSTLASRLRGQEFALNALDGAIHDLWGKLRGVSVYRLWGLSSENLPLSNYTVGIDAPAKMVEKLREMPDWPVYKIKLGTENDLSIVRELRRHTDAPFRADANGGWTADKAIDLAQALKALNVEFIEQPLPTSDYAGAQRVYEASALPLVADESCMVEGDVEHCVGLFHGINIKPVKCGGLAPARRMALRARELGLKVMAGCMTESTVGISAVAQLLPLLDYVDMDGAVLLAKDIASGVRLDRGRCIYPPRNGTGVELLDGPLPANR